MRQQNLLRAGFLAVMGLALGQANATVTQVDGTIIPVGVSAVQAQLDLREGGNTLDMVLDAAELPEVFLPNTAVPVSFTDFAEFAGFENSFGYYNVGDEIFTDEGRKTNLHPILGCGVEMQNHAYDPAAVPVHAHHHGDPTMYIEDAEAVQTISVDFAAEQAAGRYKGGFIGFYLITPEDNDFGNGCGDYVDTAGGVSRFGYIYHTQKDLNDDGDFVHHLVYTSPTNADVFYFAFEDLFPDMMIEVDGLAPPCIPQAEICDGQDNDCDGLIDALDPDLLGTGNACQCDGVALTCADGPTFGVCQEGQTICVAGVIECTSINNGASEICDLIDNDCNNAIDDNPGGINIACDGFDLDLCPEGVTQCTAGALECNDFTGDNQELCNDFDDDCDLTTDESPIDEGGSCGPSAGTCISGVEVCIAGGILDCQGQTGPSAETCDGLDNNCNDLIDDNPIDDGGACGLTDEGPCEFGTEICLAGGLQCVGEIGPQSETCDLIDNDCDTVVDNNPIDVGSPCGTDTGVCEPGVIICTATGPQCSGETMGSGEICNSLDDDCNGVIDDSPAGVDQPCGPTIGACESGLTKCINGGIECVGGISGTTETCNGIDDNCDGVVDEGGLCGGGQCINGVCTSACDGQEFSCPTGQLCEMGFCVVNECFGVVCPPNTDGTQNLCVDGSCVAVCTTVTCPTDLVCRNTDGFCVPNNCNFLPLCEDNELCKDDACEVNPCFGIDCPTDEFCRQGDCVATCSGVDCEEGEVCIDGACVATGCDSSCTSGAVCSPESGVCIDDPCLNINCSTGEACNPTTGMCEDDPCLGVECPGTTICEFGGCYDAPEPDQDAGPPEEYVVPGGGGGGCSTSGSGGGTWLFLVFGAIFLARRKKTGLLIAPLCLVAFSLLGTGCNSNPFCLNCDDPGATNDGGLDIDATAITIDADTTDAAPGCDDGVVRPEVCNDLDDDCDGTADEDFDLETNFFNCGACDTSCEKAGTRTECIAGACDATACFAGNLDINGDIDDPFDTSDGCEYFCFVSNGGVEACDQLDNDCDGQIDEDTDFVNDDNNCGQCGRVCDFFEATATCDNSLCSFNPATDCSAGFIDSNMTQADGCEYNCTPANGGVEICNLVDEDCDGGIDEDFDTNTNVAHCGQCDRVCTFLNATPSCALGVCEFNPATDCDANFFDINGTQADGCEYGCTPSNGGVEICDLVDNDCNGTVDNVPVDEGLACNNGPMGIATGACTDTGSTVCSLGVLVCVGAPEPTAESCNNVDDDCDGQLDELLTQACYTGPGSTQNVGLCVGGLQSCSAGVFTGPCVGEVTPAASEICDNRDEDCDAQVDEAAGGGPIVQSCYSGTGGTAGVGECVAGNESCTFGVFGACQGETVDTLEVCGDTLDTDCDNVADVLEGCLVAEVADQRIDANGGNGTAAGAQHSFDLVIASGGTTAGEQRIYASWSDLSNGNSDIFFARSSDGGTTWLDVQNLTGGLGDAAVKPIVITSPGGVTDDVHVVFQSVNTGVRDIQVISSTDSGANFSALSGALDGAEDSFHHDVAISSDGSLLAVVWEELDTGTLERNIHSRISTDSGSSFEAQRTINVGSGGLPIAGRPQVGITSTDQFVYVWREIRAGVTSDVFAAFSSSATAAINGAEEFRIDGDVGDTEDVDLPVLKVVDQAAYVVWQNLSTVPGAGSDIIFLRSTDNGETYSSEVIVDDPALEVSASFTPTIDVDPAGAGAGDDRVFIAWEDRREGTQIFASSSFDGGANFDTPGRASSDAGDPISGVTRGPRLLYAGGDVLVVAYMNDDPGTADHVYVASSIDAGATWTFSQEVLDTGIGNALNPVITRATATGIANGACIGWNDFRSATGINGDPYIRRIGQ
jgi:hypothetical protein